ncbi:hypothetical protein [Leptospira venezuelensis]|uniref:hypothetical protein n=1 Tax=Leptospira venezuelensis TaxID=1958811 RepID=UPI001319CDF5|nr:hypothetical protein [Leptospira venezuelensis]
MSNRFATLSNFDPTKEGWLTCKKGELSPFNNKVCINKTNYLVYVNLTLYGKERSENQCKEMCQLTYPESTAKIRTGSLHKFLEEFERKIVSYQPDMRISECISKSANYSGFISMLDKEKSCVCINYLEFPNGMDDLERVTLGCSKKYGYTSAYYDYNNVYEEY